MKVKSVVYAFIALCVACVIFAVSTALIAAGLQVIEWTITEWGALGFYEVWALVAAGLAGVVVSAAGVFGVALALNFAINAAKLEAHVND